MLSIRIIEPIIYYWEDEQQEIMTAACKYGPFKYGLSFPVSKNETSKRMDKKKLVRVLQDTIDILLNHGNEVLDQDGNINWSLANNSEARRAFLDRHWIKKLKFFRKSIVVKEISLIEAQNLCLV